MGSPSLNRTSWLAGLVIQLAQMIALAHQKIKRIIGLRTGLLLPCGKVIIRNNIHEIAQMLSFVGHIAERSFNHRQGPVPGRCGNSAPQSPEQLIRTGPTLSSNVEKEKAGADASRRLFALEISKCVQVPVPPRYSAAPIMGPWLPTWRKTTQF